MKAIFKTILKPYNAAAGALFLLMVVWLFIIPHGVADNGDFYRVMYNMGLSHFDVSSKDNYFYYFNDKFRITNYFIENKVSFLSTQSLFIWLSVKINMIFSRNVYDVRFLALLYGIVYLWVSRIILKLVYDAVPYLCGIIPSLQRVCTQARWAFTALYVLIFGDFGYLLYFNSFFGEAMSFTMLLLYAAASGLIIARRKLSAPYLILYTLSAVLFAGAKQQNAPTGIIIAAFTVCFVILRRGKRWRALVAVCASVICAASVITYVAISDEIQYINEYHAMTMGVMQFSQNPRVLKDLGLNPQLMILKGTTVYNRYPIVIANSPLMYSQMYNRVSTFKLAAYYLRHPDTLLAELDSVTSKAYEIKPLMVGNFLKSAGHAPLAKSYFFSLWSVVKPHIFPRSIGFVGLFYVVFTAVLIIKFIIARRAGNTREMLAALFVFSVILMSLSQLATSFMGAGEADIAKHLFLFNVTFDMLFAAAVFGSACKIIKMHIKPGR